MATHLGPGDLERWLEANNAAPQRSSTNRLGLAGSLFEASFQLLSSLVEEGQRAGSISSQIAHSCQNELERLFLWGDGFGAGEGELDNILENSTELRVNVLSLLSEIGKVATQNMFKVIRPVGSAERFHAELSELQRLIENAEAVVVEEGGTTRQYDAFSDSDVSEGDFAEGVGDLSTYTDCLMDLSPALENPATDVDFKEQPVSKIETFRVSSVMAASYCHKIRDRFPDLDVRLVERLGEANQKRSQRIIENSSTETKAQNKDNPQPDYAIFSESRTNFTDTTKSTYFSDSVFSKVQKVGLTKEEYDDAASQTTFASFSTTFSMSYQGRPRVPNLPAHARAGKPFQCMACGKQLKNIRNRRMWKKHIFNDLQPYVCTEFACDLAGKTFESRSSWIQHESSHQISGESQRLCPFCPGSKGSIPGKTYLKHLSRHLREVALAVLPQTHNSDSDSEGGSDSSNKAASDIELNDASDGSKSTTSVQASISEELNVQDIPLVSIEASTDEQPLSDVEPPDENSNFPQQTIKQFQDDFENTSQLNVRPPTPPKTSRRTGTDQPSATSDSRQIQPCRYKTGKTLAAGSYSVVKECVHIDTGKYLAAKVINKRLMAGKEHLVRNKIASIKRLSGHRNILPLVDYFETLNNLYLVTDLALGGELYDRICTKGSYFEADAANIIHQVLSGVAYLHENDVILGNLRPESLLFRTPEDDADLLILITDIVMSSSLDEDNFTDEMDPFEFGFYAPERVKHHGPYSPSREADMWAIGVITYFLLCGYTPFDRDNHMEEELAILAADYSFTPVEYWRGVSAAARDFIKRCLTIDPKERITAHEALNHPFLTEKPLSRRNTGQLSLTPPRRRLKSHIWAVIFVLRICETKRKSKTINLQELPP